MYIRGKVRVILEPPGIFREGYTAEDNTQVTLFTDKPEIFPGYSPCLALDGAVHGQRVKVSLVATVRNESQSAVRWMEGIFNQSRLPDEIILVDAGSIDGTYKILKDLAEKSPIPIKILEFPGANISQGRNLAIRQASGDVIVGTDFGSFAHSDWLELLVAPFEIESCIEVSGGWCELSRLVPESIRYRFWLDVENKDPQSVLPSSRSIAFRKSAWEMIGGYPEWMTLTGEDTYFDLELKRSCRYWAFVPEALVDWEAPDTLWRHWKKIVSWSRGDGETGVNAQVYWHAFLVTVLTSGGLLLAVMLGVAALVFGQWGLGAVAALLVLALSGFRVRKAPRKGSSIVDIVWQIGAMAAQSLGYLEGGLRRGEVSRRRLRGVRGVFFILAVIPMDDTGGGGRSAQMAQELVRQQYAVVYIYRFGKAESVELKLKFRHPNLFSYRAREFDLGVFCQEKGIEVGKQKMGVLVEFPHPDWLGLIGGLRDRGAVVVYDLLDDWKTVLGAAWYQEGVEREIVKQAEVLVATAPVLKERLEKETGRAVLLMPNAVNRRLFRTDRRVERPRDLPMGGWVMIYIGAVYGSWFDWELLVGMGRRYPEGKVVVIGDYEGQCREKLGNLHFLGLKANRELPGYLAHSQVGVIPWKVEPITLATSPLKLYEYLAMGKPVVVPDLPMLRGIPGVWCSSSEEEFMVNIEAARNHPPEARELETFLKDNSWQTRIQQLCRALNTPR